MIQKLNKDIDDEYIRLAQQKHRPMPEVKECRLTKWLGIKYLTGSDTGRLHSSTAFVEFRSLAAKQEAVQCNITGTSNFVVVKPVPEIRDILWENAHISRAMIHTRKGWANLALTGMLVGWSFFVSVVRSYQNVSSWLELDVAQEPAVAAFLDYYCPALVVEGCVRIIPFIISM
jgi:hypothetical protein